MSQNSFLFSALLLDHAKFPLLSLNASWTVLGISMDVK